jgi:ethanolamine ammonia-lyase large subunit
MVMADGCGSAPRNVPHERHGTGRDARCADRLQPANGKRLDAPDSVRASTMEPGSMAIDDAAVPLNPPTKRMRVSRPDQAASQHRASTRSKAIFHTATYIHVSKYPHRAATAAWRL